MESELELLIQFFCGQNSIYIDRDFFMIGYLMDISGLTSYTVKLQ